MKVINSKESVINIATGDVVIVPQEKSGVYFLLLDGSRNLFRLFNPEAGILEGVSYSNKELTNLIQEGHWQYFSKDQWQLRLERKK